jgi:hypothetical protein
MYNTFHFLFVQPGNCKVKPEIGINQVFHLNIQR